ncbi:MAG: DUF1080 domain-containing protein [Ruminococcaceae bacterium]|nr:DUF1080 domain-containing protein [Oscillospiraceae bacterium]
MFKRFLSLLLSLTMLLSCFNGLNLVSTAAEDVASNEKTPVAYYTFDNGDLSDSSGNGYDGSAVGGGNLTYESNAGRGKVLELNNKGLKRDTGSNGFDIPVDGLKKAESFTLVMDMYVETDGGNQVWFDLSRGKSRVDAYHYIVGLLAYSSYGINSELGTATLVADTTTKVRAYNKVTFDGAGKWVQMAYVNDGGSAKIYLDGVEVASANQVYSVADMLTVEDTTLTVGMAGYFNDLALDAKLDNVAVFDSALTPDELRSRTSLPLEAWYDFETNNIDDSTLIDASGNGNNATVLNGASAVSDVTAGGSVLRLDNAGVNGSSAKGLALPASLFSSMDEFTVVMDVKLNDNSKNWTSLMVGGTDKSNYMVNANRGYSGGAIGITSSTKINGGSSARISAPSDTMAPVGEWTRAVFTQDSSGNAEIYLGGELVASGTLNTTLKALASLDGSEIRIGSNHIFNDPGLDGRIDNIRVYSAVLSSGQIASIPFGYNDDAIDDVYFEELGENGLVADYHLFNADDMVFGDYKVTYVESNIASSDMEPTIKSRTGFTDYVGVCYSGKIAAPESGYYTFYTYSDNGVRLTIDKEVLLEWWVNKWDVEQTSTTVYLEKGVPHDFKFEWFECSGGSHVTLYWANDCSLAKRIVPASAFYLPADFDLPVISSIDTQGAELEQGKENFGGILTLSGANLNNAETFELIKSSGVSLETPVFFDVVSKNADTAVLTVPTDITAGNYKIKAAYGEKSTVSENMFNVTMALGESDRTEHPDPNRVRDSWVSLNGWWDFTFDADEVGIAEEWYVFGNKEYDQKINVPYPWESALSGINDTSYRGVAWYQRVIPVDESWIAAGKTTHLHFGAVDAKCIVYVNGKEVGRHDGGYTQFEFDITDYVVAGDNVITLWVEDKADYDDESYAALVGKQGHNAPCGYTHSSGIWQTVYLESRDSTYLEFAHANPNVAIEDGEDNSVQFDLGIISECEQTLTVKYSFESRLWDETAKADIPTGSSFTETHTVSVTAGENILQMPAIVIDNAKWWSDKEANLYYGTIEISDASGNVLDSVGTYFGLREVYTAKYAQNEYEYIYLNGKPVFLAGLLDQGYWAEGIYTAPDEEALKFDILQMKKLGFNMIRKHLKIEDPLQYYWCDKLGMFVWQDMPHATAMNASAQGDATPGRAVYETALMSVLDRDYNRPSVIMMILFNETWGISHTGAKSGDDGMTTHEWMQYLYHKVAAYNPGLLIEDMSACHEDHIQPTDVNTFHMYPNSYQAAYNMVKEFVDGAYAGSGDNFYNGFPQEGEPLLNSEFGGVGAYEGDFDVSLCFKYQTDIMRMYQKMNGYVYTEPYDIEYERNGIMTYDRRTKLFPYSEIAYGGDMSMVDLNQPNYVGIDAEPARELTAGAVFSADAVALNWSGDMFENAVLKWRFDATDVYGNNITTGICGETGITYAAYTSERYNITFNVPNQTCVGTLTVWIEENGVKVANNFVNVVVTAPVTAAVDYIDENSVALRKKDAEQQFTNDGSISVEYDIPKGYDLGNLNALRVIAEISSVKGSSVTNGITNSAYAQTTVGSERPSDMTVYVNGIEIDTVYIPDNPRDIRGTLTLSSAYNSGSSAGDFGYLLNINIPSDKIDDVRSAIEADGKITVTYSVERDAENKNGLRLYGDTTGRYAVDPTVILNPVDIYGNATPENGNYTVTAILSDEEVISLRGGAMVAKLCGNTLSLGTKTANVGEGTHTVTVRVFDEHYQAYVDDDPVPVIDLYNYTPYISTEVSTTGSELVIAPETYVVAKADKIAQSDVQFADHYNDDTFDSRYQISGGSWIQTDGKLSVTAEESAKATVANVISEDIIVETDITLDSGEDIGVVIRDGYYITVSNGNIRIECDGNILSEKTVTDITYNKTNRLKVVAVGSRIRVYLNNELKARMDVYDTTYPSGAVALYACNASGSYDNTVISTAPRYKTDFANGKLSEWTVLGEYEITDSALVGSGDILVGNVGWTDLGMRTDVTVSNDVVAGLILRGVTLGGKLYGYYVTLDAANDKIQIRKVVAGIDTIIAETDMAVDSGTYNICATAVNNGIRVYVNNSSEAVLAINDNDYMSGMAGLVTISGTASFDNVDITDKFVYIENFSDGTLSGWSKAADIVSVANNILTIKQVPKGPNGDKVWDGYATWDNYVMEMDMKMTIRASKSNAGFMFRGTDFTAGVDNYRGYVLGINTYEDRTTALNGNGIEFGDIHYGFRSIKTLPGSTFSPLGNKWYHLKVTVNGDTVTVNVDGTDYFTATDSAYLYGQFGMRIYTTAASFKNLTVTPITADILGDVNSDGQITIMDVLMLIRAVCNDEYIENGDISGDKKIDLIDVLRAMKRIAQ